MSKLADLIRRITRVEGAPMGFGPTERRSTPTMLLAARVPDSWARAAGEAAQAGADVLLLAGRPDDQELADAVSAADGRPCGLQTAEPNSDDVAKLSKAGLTFLAIGPEAPAALLHHPDIGIALHVSSDLTDVQLQTINSLSIEALYPDLDADPLTIQRQMELHRLAGLARTPLMLPIGEGLSEDDLLCLRDAGVALVILDGKRRGAVEELRRLRGVIDALPPRRRPSRDEAPGVFVPRAEVALPGEDDDEGDGRGPGPGWGWTLGR